MDLADLVSLPTLPLDKSSILGTIDILKVYLKDTLELDDHVVQNKCIILKGNFLTLRNIIKDIYSRHGEPLVFNYFQYIEPIAGFFYLQMNMLKLFLGASCGKKDNCVSLAHFKVILGRNKALQDTKDFHACNDFFKTIAKSFAILLCMHGARSTNIAIFKTWLLQNDWQKMI